MLFAAAAIFVYYTAWTILLVSPTHGRCAPHIFYSMRLQPFFDDTSPVHDYFPSREWAVRIPALILVVGISAISLFLGLAVVRERRL